jgi:phosphoribosylformylglycinamidine synthase
MKCGVVTFPGSNCDRDLVHALREISSTKVVELWHKDTDLQGCRLVCLPGGFSYGDYLRTGAIARFSPIMKEVVRFAQGGGYVLGICNGFQILCEAGLLPGALLPNASTLFVSQTVHIKAVNTTCALTKQLLNPKVCAMPVAHGEGNYYCDTDTLKALQDADQVVFKYVNPNGAVLEESNPNGSLDNIAGICNARHTVFGMMPHPERAADAYMGATDGLQILRSLVNEIG